MNGILGVETVHVDHTSLNPPLLKETKMLLRRAEVRGGRERGIVVAFYAEIVAVAVIRIVRPPVIRVVVIVVTADGTHADATVRGKRNVVRVAKEYLANGGLPMRGGA